MALLFGANAGDRVSIGASAGVTNQAALSMVAWVRVNTASVIRNIFIYGQTASVTIFNFTSADSFQFQMNRATLSCLVNANVSNFAAWILGEWVCVAGRIDTAGANGDQQLFIGRAGLPLEPPSSYLNQRVGSGTPQANTGTPIIGNSLAANTPFRGDIAYLKIFNVALTHGELIQEQFSMAPVNSNCVGYYRFGQFGLGEQIDLRTGNNGVVTSATWSPTPPDLILTPRRFRTIHKPAVTAATWPGYQSLLGWN